MNIFENVHGRSLADFLSLHTNDRHLKAVLSVHCLLNGVPPNEQGLNNYAYIAGPYYESVNFIDGGGSALVDAYKKSAETNDVDIYTGMDAERLLFTSSGGLKGIGFKDETEIDTTKVISTIHPLNLLGLVHESRFRASYVKRIRSLDETPSAYIVYGRCKSDLAGRIGSGVYLVPEDGIDFTCCKKPVEDRPMNLLVSRSGALDSKTGSGFILLCPASIKEVEKWKNSTRGNRSPEYIEFKEMTGQRMLDHFVSFFPDLRGKLDAVEFSTPLTLGDYTGSPFGSMYGVKHRIEQYSPFPMTNIKGLHLAGQSISAPGLLGTMISAFLACGNILGHDFLRGELKRWN
jgi:all-trans-retinol 13,14-reductase